MEEICEDGMRVSLNNPAETETWIISVKMSGISF